MQVNVYTVQNINWQNRIYCKYYVFQMLLKRETHSITLLEYVLFVWHAFMSPEESIKWWKDIVKMLQLKYTCNSENPV